MTTMCLPSHCQHCWVPLDFPDALQPFPYPGAHQMVKTELNSLRTTSLPPKVPISKVPDAIANDVAVQNLETLPCDDKLCNGRGKCMSRNGDLSCSCSLGYSGDFCQDHLVRLNSPLTYGAAAGGAGLLLIIVVVSVVKRRTASSQR